MVNEAVLTNWRSGSPKGVLLATDWSPRCDRPLDRAIQLAHYWGAWLTILTVVEGDAPGTDRDAIEQRIKAWALHEMPALDLRFHVDIAFGNVVEHTLGLAAERGVDLIVTGVAHHNMIGDYGLGTTVDRLVRTATVPVLVVKRRARYGYERAMIATDYSACLPRALDLRPAFPRAHCALVEADSASASLDQAEREDLVAQAPDDVRARVVRRTVQGAPVEALSRLIRKDAFDLTVVCRHGRDSRIGALIGGTAAKLIDGLPSDVLVVP